MKRIVIALLLAGIAAPAAAQDIDGAIGVMRQVASQCPRAFANAHRAGNPEAWDYIILAAQALKRFDPAFGMNGKRGNPSDPSYDAIAYSSGAGLRIVDVIAGAPDHNGDLNAIVWQDVTAQSTVNGVVMGFNIDPIGRSPVVPCGSDPQPGPSRWETQRHGAVLSQLAGKGISDTKRIAEQFAFSFPSEGWGQKSADPSRPTSQDVIARRAGGALVGYRVVPFNTAPAEIALGGQHFVAVTAIDHVGAGVVPGGGGNPGGGNPGGGGSATNLQPILDRIATLEQTINAMKAAVDGLGGSVLPAMDAARIASESARDAALEQKATAENTRQRLEDVVTNVDRILQELAKTVRCSGRAKVSGTLDLECRVQ